MVISKQIASILITDNKSYLAVKSCPSISQAIDCG